MRRLLPKPDEEALTQADLDLAYGLPLPAPGTVHVRANFVSSADGAAEVGGRSAALGGPGDRQVFRTLRWLADVVLVGAGTARAENYGGVVVPEERRELRAAAGLAPVPPVAVVTGSAALDPGARLFTAEVRPLVLTTTRAPAERVESLRAVCEVVFCGDDDVEPSAAAAELAARGLARVLTEGGPTLHGRFASAGLLDELCLTVAPVLGGPGHLGIVAGPPWTAARRMELAHVLEEDGSLFLRYLLEKDSDLPRA